MQEFSVPIGGKAGNGIRQAGIAIARLTGRSGYRIFFCGDYPSLIRGGHNFSIIRASRRKISAHQNRINIIVALNQETVELHSKALTENEIILYDSDSVKLDGIGVVAIHPENEIAVAVMALGAASGSSFRIECRPRIILLGS